ncbi:hypothetical protein EXU30_17725 [Shewanella maritima]|uniref:Uncharacterized protein n=1 Tax=Shewanella maritima TaxID=2520507 RepID=A0A411PLB1_9GAMM|nr:hypothetical protein [Shewanella maritima]QBF84307.1 hypothetical protein EXU30_17725 [Shewanella maritima]
MINIEKLHLDRWLKLKNKKELSLFEALKLQHPLFYLYLIVALFTPLVASNFYEFSSFLKGVYIGFLLCLVLVVYALLNRSSKLIPIQLKYLDWDKVENADKLNKK